MSTTDSISRILSAFIAVVALAGCSALGSPGGRIGLLVLLPLAFIALFLWALRARRGPQRESTTDRRRFPDADEGKE